MPRKFTYFIALKMRMNNSAFDGINLRTVWNWIVQQKENSDSDAICWFRHENLRPVFPVSKFMLIHLFFGTDTCFEHNHANHISKKQIFIRLNGSIIVQAILNRSIPFLDLFFDQAKWKPHKGGKSKWFCSVYMLMYINTNEVCRPLNMDVLPEFSFSFRTFFP